MDEKIVAESFPAPLLSTSGSEIESAVQKLQGFEYAKLLLCQYRLDEMFDWPDFDADVWVRKILATHDPSRGKLEPRLIFKARGLISERKQRSPGFLQLPDRAESSYSVDPDTGDWGDATDDYGHHAAPARYGPAAAGMTWGQPDGWCPETVKRGTVAQRQENALAPGADENVTVYGLRRLAKKRWLRRQCQRPLPAWTDLLTRCGYPRVSPGIGTQPSDFARWTGSILPSKVPIEPLYSWYFPKRGKARPFTQDWAGTRGVIDVAKATTRYIDLEDELCVREHERTQYMRLAYSIQQYDWIYEVGWLYPKVPDLIAMTADGLRSTMRDWKRMRWWSPSFYSDPPKDGTWNDTGEYIPPRNKPLKRRCWPLGPLSANAVPKRTYRAAASKDGGSGRLRDGVAAVPKRFTGYAWMGKRQDMFATFAQTCPKATARILARREAAGV
jgi:hypothetical protein